MPFDKELGLIVDKDGSPTPTWLEGTLGSLAEERRESRNRDYSKLNSQIRSARKRFYPELSWIQLISNPKRFKKQMSHLEASYPSISIELQFNIQEITKSDQRLLRSFLFYIYSIPLADWVRFLIEESLDKVLRLEGNLSKGKIFRENLIIRQTFLVLGPNLGLQLLREIYSEDNIRKWTNTGENLIRLYPIVKIPYIKVKQKVYRRGYKESSCNNKFKTKSVERRIIESMEYQDLEATRRRILKKQAELFEKRLDRYLQIESQELDQVEKRRIFQSLLDSDLDSYQSNNVNQTNEEEN